MASRSKAPVPEERGVPSDAYLTVSEQGKLDAAMAGLFFHEGRTSSAKLVGRLENVWSLRIYFNSPTSVKYRALYLVHPMTHSYLEGFVGGMIYGFAADKGTTGSKLAVFNLADVRMIDA